MMAKPSNTEKVKAAGRAFLNAVRQLGRQERSQLLDFAAFDSVEKTAAFQKCFGQARQLDNQADPVFYAKVITIFVFAPREGTFTDTENNKNFGHFLRENGIIQTVLAESLFKSNNFNRLIEETEVLLSRHKPQHQLDFGLLIKDLYSTYLDFKGSDILAQWATSYFSDE